MSSSRFPLPAEWLALWHAGPATFAERCCTLGAELAGVQCASERQDGAPTDWLAGALGAELLARGWTMATAESCTGGWLGAALTAIPGSSAWVEGGLITYSNAAKTELLGVPAGLIRDCGAVSAPVVTAMVAGACARLHTHCAVAASGVAGPGGGSASKPVGTVWLAWSTPLLEQPLSQVFQFPGDRAAVREGAVWAGLTGLLALCMD